MGLRNRGSAKEDRSWRMAFGLGEKALEEGTCEVESWALLLAFINSEG
jgi:hypothetical protein